MRRDIPEDLTDYPDVAPETPRPVAAADAPPPEDVTAFPAVESDAPVTVDDEEARRRIRSRARKSARRIGVVAVFGMLFLLAVVALAVVLGVRGATEYVREAFRFHAGYGTLVVFLLALLVGSLGVLVASEVRAYGRLASFDGLREDVRRLDAEAPEAGTEARVRERMLRLLDCIGKAADEELRTRIERLRDRMDLADDAAEWLEDAERILLAPLDEAARDAIRREAVNVGIGTAVSPYAFLDAAVTLWRNVRLVRGIASIYRVRAGFWGTAAIMRRTIIAVAFAELAQEASTALLGTLRGLPRLLSPFSQGLINAAMTIRVGIKAREECRPLPFSKKAGAGTAALLGESVLHAVRRAVRVRASGKAGADVD